MVTPAGAAVVAVIVAVAVPVAMIRRGDTVIVSRSNGGGGVGMTVSVAVFVMAPAVAAMVTDVGLVTGDVVIANPAVDCWSVTSTAAGTAATAGLLLCSETPNAAPSAGTEMPTAPVAPSAPSTDDALNARDASVRVGSIST